MSNIESRRKINFRHSVPSVVRVLVLNEYKACLEELKRDGNLEPIEIIKRKKLLGEKWQHTSEAVQATGDIMRENQYKIDGTEIEWNEFQACAIAELHDRGRFKEAVLLGTYDRARTHFDHASESYNQFTFEVTEVNTQFGGFIMDILETSGCDAKVINFAVLNHDKREVVSDDPYLKLIRDADKLANLRYIKKNLKKYKNQEVGEDTVSGTVMDDLRQGKLVDMKKVRSYAEKVVYYIAWMNEINFESTRKILIRENIISDLIGMLEVDSETRSEIIRCLVANWNNKSN